MDKSPENPARAAFVGALVAALITLPGLGAGTLWDNSETAYGEVAREILLTHNWAIMHFNSVPYFVQPPLYFWLGALFAEVLGMTSLALRLPSALATVALAATTGYAVARQAGTRTGIYASVILSSSLMVAVIGRLAIMDALLDLAIAMTVFWWFRGLQTGRDGYVVYGWIAAAFGFLAKGLVAPVISLLVIVPFFVWNRRIEATHLSIRGWLLGLAAFFAIAVPWPAVLVARYGWFSLEKLVGVYTIGRYTGVIENQAGPIWYYLPVMLLGFFPWIAFLPMAIVYTVRGRANQEPTGRLTRLALCWIVVPLAFFSFAGTKLPNYVALEFPALAVLTALYFEAVAQRGGMRSAVYSASFVTVAVGLMAVAIAIFAQTNRLGAAVPGVAPGLAGFGIAIFAGALACAVMLAKKSLVSAAPYALAVATIVAMDTISAVVLPRVEAFKPIPRLAAIVNRERAPYDRVAIQNTSGGNALLFYTRPDVDVLQPASGPDPRIPDAIDPRTAICGAPRVWLVAPKERPAFDPTYGRRRTLIAADMKAALYVYDGPACLTPEAR